MSLKRLITTYTMQFGLIMFIAGILLTILGIFGVFYSENAPQFIKSTLGGIGNWKYWCVLIGPIFLIAGGWYFFDSLNKRKEFKGLMETTSKAKFIRNQDRVEYLAWKLTSAHQSELAEKKQKFKIK